ncbi:MarR family winged helix-turn-helix transcriptional regulator [Actinomadura sp. 21ATH]|uniref:MarR family winged helix-turn-helix transcriptional regulator n=1 Tax=Actinomadura sp. 21ATH TaxID=1735444 RepID=UPI0035C06D89
MVSTFDRDRPDAIDALRAIRGLHAQTEALLDAIAGRYGLYRTDLRCLEILQREGEMRARRLAELSHLSPAAVTKVVDRLVTAGYATRRQSTQDRRAQIIGVSARHSAFRAAIWDPVQADAVAVLEAASAQELRTVITLVHRLTEVNRAHARSMGAGSSAAEPAAGDASAAR